MKRGCDTGLDTLWLALLVLTVTGRRGLINRARLKFVRPSSALKAFLAISDEEEPKPSAASEDVVRGLDTFRDCTCHCNDDDAAA